MHPDLTRYFNQLCELPDYEGIAVTSVNQRDRFGSTPLHAAVIQNRADMVILLLKHGADINALGERGETPLQTALIMENKEIEELLLREGAQATKMG